MKKFTKALSFILSAVLLTLSFSGCSTKPQNTDGDTATTIRYLNFKPEIASYYEELSKLYKEETGVTVIVDTAANNQYESTLTAKMATDEAPTLFQINGPKGYSNWRDYCADLSGTKLYDALNDKSLAITDKNGRVFGIPYVVEGYGIIYNEAITDKYFKLSNRAAKFDSMDDVDSFEKLKTLVEDMQKRKDELGIKGVFASTSLKSGEDWRWQTHLANVPLYYEFEKNAVDLASDDTEEITFEFSKNFKNIFDLYLNNSVIPKTAVATKTVTDSMSEFALEECAMVQNGNWAWSQISGISGNKVKEDNIEFLPIFTGADGEENQGLCIGTENFYAINKNSSDTERKAAEDFIYWLYSSDTGKKYVTEKFGFIAPFNTFSQNEVPNDPLAREVMDWMDEDDIKTIPWNFTIFPSATFKEDFGASLLKYAQGTKTFDDVKNDMVASWKKEAAALKKD